MVQMKIQSCCAFCQVQSFTLPVKLGRGDMSNKLVIRQIGVNNIYSDMNELQMID